MLYARLVEQGAASWGATVEELFSTTAVHEGWHQTTVEQLLSHAGGLTDAGLLGVWQLIKSELDERPLPHQRLPLATKALSRPAKGQSGQFKYSNANYVVIGSAIEQLTGMTWEAAIRQELFQPLEMLSAGFGAPSGAQPLGHKRSWLPWKGLQPVRPGPAADNPAFMRPAGGVHITPEDYAKFIRVFLNGGSPFLSTATMQNLVTPLSKGPSYGLGWLVDDLPWAGGRALLHDGSNTMWYATAVVGLESGIGAMVASNEGTEVAARAVHALARELLEEAG